MSDIGMANGPIITLVVVSVFVLLLWYLNYSTRRRHQQERALAETRRAAARLNKQNAEHKL